NPFTPVLAGFRNIISNRDLVNVELTDDTVFVINVHLNWAGSKLSNNYGFDVANELRTRLKSKSPIIFYSPIQVAYFEKKSEKEIKYKIIFGRGSAFIETPFTEEELNKLVLRMQPLSMATLHDVATMLCDLKGIVIDKLNHDLKFDADIDLVIDGIAPYLSALQKKLIGLDKFIVDIKESLKTGRQDVFNNLKLQFITLCNQELTEKGQGKLHEKKTNHRVLVLDDLLEEIARAKKYLERDFIIEISTTGEQAISILKKDIKNEIVAIIADWRLFTDEKQNYWQSLQGYEVFEYAARNGIRSMFAITSQADFVVHHLRNLMGIRFSMFKKENLRTADQWKVFSDVLYEACEKAVESRASILDEFPIWKKPWVKKSITQLTLKEQYIALWNSVDRNSVLNMIDRKIEEMWNYLLDTKDPYLIGHESFSEYAISLKVLDLKKVLVLRRIWFGLWFNYMPTGKLDSDRLRRHTEMVYKKMFGAPGDGSIAQRTYNLCIQLDKIKAGYMLPEEIEWLNKKGSYWNTFT
ncbi:MAG: hypothetical protein KDD14_17035, partial [Saprospiraceae bacterium]|nr:hypothetical protein [Saprospiraceae bacterium]